MGGKRGRGFWGTRGLIFRILVDFSMRQIRSKFGPYQMRYVPEGGKPRINTTKKASIRFHITILDVSEWLEYSSQASQAGPSPLARPWPWSWPGVGEGGKGGKGEGKGGGELGFRV